MVHSVQMVSSILPQTHGKREDSDWWNEIGDARSTNREDGACFLYLWWYKQNRFHREYGSSRFQVTKSGPPIHLKAGYLFNWQETSPNWQPLTLMKLDTRMEH